jgi:hypothetical protein
MGRIRLLLAKLGAIFIFGLIVLAVALIIHAALLVLALQLNQGSLNDLAGLPSFYFSDTFANVATLIANLAVNILFAATLATLGRSLALGLSVALPYFLVENIATSILTAVAFGTGNHAWHDATGYFLGENLSALTSQLIPARGFNFEGQANGPAGPTGFPFDGTHAIVMTAAYAAIFLGASLLLVKQRDVTQ